MTITVISVNAANVMYLRAVRLADNARETDKRRTGNVKHQCPQLPVPDPALTVIAIFI